MKITKDTKIGVLLNEKKYVNVLGKFEFPCLSCPMAKIEMNDLNMGDVCKFYKIPLKKILDELNKIN